MGDSCDTGGCGCGTFRHHDPEVEMALQLANEVRFNEAVDRGNTMKVLHMVEGLRRMQRKGGKTPLKIEEVNLALGIEGDLVSSQEMLDKALMAAAEAVEWLEVVVKELK